MTLDEAEPKHVRTSRERHANMDGRTRHGTRPPLNAPPGQWGVTELLSVEDKIRNANDERELVFLAANEIRRLVAARQLIVLRTKSQGRLRVECISSLATVNRDAPFVTWVENLAARIVAEHGQGSSLQFELPAFTGSTSQDTQSYPFRHVLWQPIVLPDGSAFAAILATRETPWSEQERRILEREARVVSAAWRAIYGAQRLAPRSQLRGPRRIALILGIGLIAIFPVPLVALAPVEIVAVSPQRINAPIDGVIQEILVEPNRSVKPGDVVLSFDQTTLRNRLDVSEQEMLVAKARLDQARQAAFNDDKSRHDIAIAQAEFEMKRAERNFASELLARSKVTADRAGVLVYADKDRWIGRPVKTGERIMQIVDPTAVAGRIELPIADAIVMEKGSRVRLFLDSNPLSAVPGRLASEGYMAEPNAVQQLVYTIHVDLDPEAGAQRIGARGTAQIQGHLVPLIFYLLRRPITAVRQSLGL